MTDTLKPSAPYVSEIAQTFVAAHSGQIMACVPSEDGERFYTLGQDMSTQFTNDNNMPPGFYLKAWNAKLKSVERRVWVGPGDQPATSLDVSGDTILVVAGNTILLFDESLYVVDRLTVESGQIGQAAFLSCNELIAFNIQRTNKCGIALWDPKARSHGIVHSLSRDTEILRLRSSGYRRRFVCSSLDATNRAVLFEHGFESKLERAPRVLPVDCNWILGLAIHPNGSCVATVGLSEHIDLHYPDKEPAHSRPMVSPVEVNDLAWLSETALLALGDRSLHVWNVTSGSIIRSVPIESGPRRLESMAVSEDYQTAYIATNRGGLIIVPNLDKLAI